MDCATCAFEAGKDRPPLDKTLLSCRLQGYWTREPFWEKARELAQKQQFCSYHLRRQEILENIAEIISNYGLW